MATLREKISDIMYYGLREKEPNESDMVNAILRVIKEVLEELAD